MKKIIITKNGPYKVLGGIPLNELIIEPGENGNKYVKGRTFEVKEEYYLCRCGKSSNPPFCDGSHTNSDFDGTLSDIDTFNNIVDYEGEELLLHDHKDFCAFARFCHNNKTDVWTATENDDIENAKKLSMNCPAGRMVLIDKDGNELENTYEEEISILQDPSRNCSGPIWVKGNIQIEDEDGKVYAKRNRVTLCRCGESYNKPFCDANHVSSEFNDQGNK